MINTDIPQLVGNEEPGRFFAKTIKVTIHRILPQRLVVNDPVIVTGECSLGSPAVIKQVKKNSAVLHFPRTVFPCKVTQWVALFVLENWSRVLYGKAQIMEINL